LVDYIYINRYRNITSIERNEEIRMTCLASRIKKKVVGRRMKRQTHKVCSLKTLNVFFGESDLEFLRLVLVGVSANGRVKT